MWLAEVVACHVTPKPHGVALRNTSTCVCNEPLGEASDKTSLEYPWMQEGEGFVVPLYWCFREVSRAASLTTYHTCHGTTSQPIIPVWILGVQVQRGEGYV